MWGCCCNCDPALDPGSLPPRPFVKDLWVHLDHLGQTNDMQLMIRSRVPNKYKGHFLLKTNRCNTWIKGRKIKSMLVYDGGLLHESMFCSEADFNSIMAVAASKSHSVKRKKCVMCTQVPTTGVLFCLCVCVFK